LDSKSALRTAKKVLTADLSCEEGDFDKEGVFIYQAREIEGARQFPLREKSFQMATFGTGSVISCSYGRIQWANTYLSQLNRDELFSAPIISLIGHYISTDNQFISGPDLKYICTPYTFQPCSPVSGIDIELLRDEEVNSLYQDNRFMNAIGHYQDPKRPRLFAATANKNGKIVGIAAASADCNEMYQIGVDVSPDHRNLRIGSVLVSRLTEVIIDTGIIPYYSTWPANIASRRLALNIGYWPAWIEVYARDNSERQ
jgi:GNAT superfamily N-acetyltransferase